MHRSTAGFPHRAEFHPNWRRTAGSGPREPQHIRSSTTDNEFRHCESFLFTGCGKWQLLEMFNRMLVFGGRVSDESGISPWKLFTGCLLQAVRTWAPAWFYNYSPACVVLRTPHPPVLPKCLAIRTLLVTPWTLVTPNRILAFFPLSQFVCNLYVCSNNDKCFKANCFIKEKK